MMNGLIKEDHQDILEETQGFIADDSISRDDKLKEICDLLKTRIDVFDWVGFYLVHPDKEQELILGPFAGEPTEHTQIAFGQGICGQAAATNETFVVQDVDEEENYLSCSAEVKAEIVAPVMKNGNFVAELDIDSHNRDSLTDDLKDLVEKICQQVEGLF